MKSIFLAILVVISSLLCSPVFSQTDNAEELLGLPGDNLDLYAVLDLFQKSKTIEDFEKSLNYEETGINNLDLNLDDKIDFIKVVTKQKGEDFSFILQVDVTEKETQDVAVILLSKDKDDKVTLQIVGDKDLYGKNYVVEPKPATPAVTPNPAYTGDDPVTESVPASTTIVVVESAPIVQYVYSPAYVPYYPPYYYGYYAPYFRAAAVVAVGVYRHNNYYHHYGYHGGYSGNVVVHNQNTYNNYNNTRNTSNTVNRNNENGRYGDDGDRRSNGDENRRSGGDENRRSGGDENRRSGGDENRRSGSSESRFSGGSNNKPSTRDANKTSTSPSARQSNRSSSERQLGTSSSRQPSSGSYGSGGRSGYSGGGRSSYSGGGRGGGGRGGRR